MPARPTPRLWSLAKALRPQRRRAAVSARPLLVEQLDRRWLLATVTLTPVADNTIYQESGTLSNGAGGFFFSGQAAANAGIRRALLKFDVAGAIPPGSHIDQATLQLHVSKIRPGSAAADFGVSRLTNDWGEGTSDASGNEGTGAPATTNDATWTFRSFNTASWTTPGGDFNAASSATTQVGGIGSYQWSSAQLVADTQLWADTPATQFGWIVKEIDETVEGSARRFDSRESTIAANRPTLTIDFTPGNRPPTLDAIADPPAIPENSLEQTIPLSGISAGLGESQALSVTATSSDPSLVPDPVVDYTSSSATGSLHYTPQSGQSGTAVITVTVRDVGLDGLPDDADDGISSRTFTVQVFDPNAANHPPSFIAGVDQAANDDSGPFGVSDWAATISPGPPAEALQTVTFIVSSDNTSLFSVQPEVDSTGKLTFTPAPNAHGTAHGTIRAKDNGGTANGGSDTSDPQTFTITIAKPHVWHNTLNGLDVTGDGHVAPGDALAVINYINAFRSGPVPEGASFGPDYFDVTNDGSVAPGDALAVINVINAGQGGEGEAADQSISPVLTDSAFRELGQRPLPKVAVDELMLLLASNDNVALGSRRRS